MVQQDDSDEDSNDSDADNDSDFTGCSSTYGDGWSWRGSIDTDTSVDSIMSVSLIKSAVNVDLWW